MDTIQLPPDFKEFLRLLNSKGVEYLVVGGYAVGYHGTPRTTGDIDIWVSANQTNVARVVEVLREFGFDVPELSPELFLAPRRVVRMGIPPFRIEILTSVSGVNFEDCYAARSVGLMDGVEVSVIGLEHLKANKRASGRLKDLADLQNLA